MPFTMTCASLPALARISCCSDDLDRWCSCGEFLSTGTTFVESGYIFFPCSAAPWPHNAISMVAKRNAAGDRCFLHPIVDTNSVVVVSFGCRFSQAQRQTAHHLSVVVYVCGVYSCRAARWSAQRHVADRHTQRRRRWRPSATELQSCGSLRW